MALGFDSVFEGFIEIVNSFASILGPDIAGQNPYPTMVVAGLIYVGFFSWHKAKRKAGTAGGLPTILFLTSETLLLTAFVVATTKGDVGGLIGMIGFIVNAVAGLVVGFTALDNFETMFLALLFLNYMSYTKFAAIKNPITSLFGLRNFFGSKTSEKIGAVASKAGKAIEEKAEEKIEELTSEKTPEEAAAEVQAQKTKQELRSEYVELEGELSELSKEEDLVSRKYALNNLNLDLCRKFVDEFEAYSARPRKLTSVTSKFKGEGLTQKHLKVLTLMKTTIENQEKIQEELETSRDKVGDLITTALKRDRKIRKRLTKVYNKEVKAEKTIKKQEEKAEELFKKAAAATHLLERKEDEILDSLKSDKKLKNFLKKSKAVAKAFDKSVDELKDALKFQKDQIEGIREDIEVGLKAGRGQDRVNSFAEHIKESIAKENDLLRDLKSSLRTQLKDEMYEIKTDKGIITSTKDMKKISTRKL